jgi:hypothetical protein
MLTSALQAPFTDGEALGWKVLSSADVCLAQRL